MKCICPKCNHKFINNIKYKEFIKIKRKFTEKKRDKIIYSIIKHIRKRSCSISQIGKDLGINRSTLRYYLNNMEKSGIIRKERIKIGLRGSPAIIHLK